MYTDNTLTISLPNGELLTQVAEMLAHGRDVTIAVYGNSMLPFLRPRTDSVVLRRLSQYTLGDIVLASTIDGPFVLHRITAIDNPYVTLMGDGNLLSTESCRITDIHGAVVTVTRKRGHTAKTISPDSISQRIKSRIWLRLLPVRRYLLNTIRPFINH